MAATLGDCTRLLELFIKEVSDATGRNPDVSRGWFQDFDLTGPRRRELEVVIGKLRTGQLDECHRELTQLRTAFYEDANYHLNQVVLPSEFIRLPIGLKTIGVSDAAIEPLRELILKFEKDHGGKPVINHHQAFADYWAIVDAGETLREAKKAEVEAEKESRRIAEAASQLRAQREREQLYSETADQWVDRLASLELLPV